jgi:hypothetical protein
VRPDADHAVALDYVDIEEQPERLAPSPPARRAYASQMSSELVPNSDAVAANFQAMLTAFDTTMANNTRRSAIPVVQRLPALVGQGDRLIAFVQARMTEPRKEKVVLAVTTTRLHAYRDGDTEPVFDAPLSSLRVIEYATEMMWGSRLVLGAPAGRTTFKQLLPGPQGDRIFCLAGGTDARRGVLDLLNGEPADPGHPPLAALWNLALYEDRLIDHEGRHLPFAGGEVTATCDSAGNIAVTRGRNLAAKGVGTVLLGPIGLFGMGNAKERQVDTRELYLLVEGPGWAYTQKFQPDLGGPLRQFAQQINVVAAKHHKTQSDRTSVPAASAPDIAAQLRELATLRDDGVLTAEEFAASKAKLLERL